MLDTGVVPVSTQTQDFDEATVDARFGLRPALKPIRITQPQGKNFTIDGGFISWQKWKFHVRYERRAGTVISLATYDGRSVLYQGSLAEVFVPYQDAEHHLVLPARSWTTGAVRLRRARRSPLRASASTCRENAVPLRRASISAALPDPTAPVVAPGRCRRWSGVLRAG